MLQDSRARRILQCDILGGCSGTERGLDGYSISSSVDDGSTTLQTTTLTRPPVTTTVQVTLTTSWNHPSRAPSTPSFGIPSLTAPKATTPNTSIPVLTHQTSLSGDTTTSSSLLPSFSTATILPQDVIGKGLKIGQVAGIATGVSIVVLCCIASGIWYCFRRIYRNTSMPDPGTILRGDREDGAIGRVQEIYRQSCKYSHVIL